MAEKGGCSKRVLPPRALLNIKNEKEKLRGRSSKRALLLHHSLRCILHSQSGNNPGEETEGETITCPTKKGTDDRR